MVDRRQPADRDWYVLDLGDPLVAAPRLNELQQRFEAAWRRLGRPADMALYVQHISEGRLQCEVRLYYSPAAAASAREAGAEPCEPPLMTAIGLIAGGGEP